MNKRIERMLKTSEFYIFIIILIISVLIHLRSGQFFTLTNVTNILRSLTVPAIYAVCAYLAFISTGTDVSFPMVAALSSYVAIETVRDTSHEGNLFVILLIAILVGALMGALNGFIIAKYDFPSMIVTLATSSIFSGILFGYFNAGRNLLPEGMLKIRENVLYKTTNSQTGLSAELPITFLFMIGIYILVYLVLHKTVAGRGVFAVGGDSSAAERAGFNVKKTRFYTFVAIGAIAGVGGVAYSLESSYHLPTEFVGKEMIVIAAIVLGGASLTGGVGTLTGCILGTLLLTIVSNSLIIVGIPVYWQNFIVGLMIIIGIAISVMDISKKKKVEVTE